MRRCILLATALACALGSATGALRATHTAAAQDPVRSLALESQKNPLVPGYKVMDRPGRGGSADEVTVKLKLRRILAISTIDTTFVADFVIQSTWIDQRLAGVLESGSPPKRVSEAQVWTPGLIFTNEAEEQNIFYSQLRVYPGGRVEHNLKGVFTLDVHIDVAMYPFDRQVLECLLDAADYAANEVRLVADVAGSETAVDEVLVWQVEQWGVTTSSHPSPYTGQNRSMVAVNLVVKRMAAMLVVELVLPLALITIFTMLALFVTDDGIKFELLCIGFLSTMAFIYVLSEHLPKIAYFTWLHAFTGLSVVTVFATMLVTLGVDYLQGSFVVSLSIVERRYKKQQQRHRDAAAPSQSLGAPLLAQPAPDSDERSCCCGKLTRRNADFLQFAAMIGVPLFYTLGIAVLTLTLYTGHREHAQ